MVTAEMRLDNLLKKTCSVLPKILNERELRLVAGALASGYGYGGIKLISRMADLDPRTVKSGVTAIEQGKLDAPAGDGSRVRAAGGGRKRVTEHNPELHDRLKELLENNTCGDPESVLVWTNLSLRDISAKLKEYHNISLNKDTVAQTLQELGYSRQVNEKNLQNGGPHPKRDEIFRFINEKAADFLRHDDPVISTDTKKKELIGNFKNAGAQCRPKGKGDPRQTLDHDFGKLCVSPYGIYELNRNTGFVNLDISHDTGSFVVEGIRRWWYHIGRENYRNAKRIMITCDSGGSNGCRVWLWKYSLQVLANETGLEIYVSHFPTGTSKWNKIEHRLFCYISRNWQGTPLIDIETVVNLIGSTTTNKGLSVICRVDERKYQTGKKITAEQKESINIEFTGPNKKWNYIIRPNRNVVS